MCLHAAGGGGVCKGMLDLELPLLLAGGGPVVKEGATWGSFKFKNVSQGVTGDDNRETIKVKP